MRQDRHTNLRAFSADLLAVPAGHVRVTDWLRPRGKGCSSWYVVAEYVGPRPRYKLFLELQVGMMLDGFGTRAAVNRGVARCAASAVDSLAIVAWRAGHGLAVELPHASASLGQRIGPPVPLEAGTGDPPALPQPLTMRGVA